MSGSEFSGSRPRPKPITHTGLSIDDFDFTADSIEDFNEVADFLAPFVEDRTIMERSHGEIKRLLEISLVARLDGQIVGFVGLEIYSPRIAELQALTVDPVYRGKGIGEKLISFCKEKAESAGVTQVLAVTGRVDLFKKRGFGTSTAQNNTAMFFNPSPQGKGKGL